MSASTTRKAGDGDPTAVVIGSVLLDPRRNGPRRSANGGFAAGTIAGHVDSETVTVVLRRPVRLGVDLDVVDDGGAGILVRDRAALVAEARPGRLTPAEAPFPPSLEDARRARDAHPLVGVRHPLSDCVVCGPARADGMHVTPGPVPGRPELLAAPWHVGTRFSRDGSAELPTVWAAMDCTSFAAQALEERVLCLLGTMTARVERLPQVGEDLVVYSWTREHHGRRYETSVAIVDPRGALVARADSTWVALKHQRLLRALSRFS